jgi:imidazolonepropionase-like amidohydrolase
MDRFLVRGKMLIDGLGSPPIERGVIVLEGEQILAVGREEKIKIEGVSRTIDCSDQTLLPGLIDCHNHLSLDPTLDNYLYRMNDSIPELTLRAATTMAVDLQSGVTTSRCLGDKGFLDVECKKAVHSGLVAGPRLLIVL